jgi:D-serine deaminase-like pyridoxal phosphate-dependent protein
MLSGELGMVIGPGQKGFGPPAFGRPLEALVRDRVNLFDGTFAPPVMVLKSSALANNIEAMAEYCRDRAIELAPHGKTTLAPQLFRRQLAAGAWAITVATPAQVALCRAAGVPRVLLANELVDPSSIGWVLGQLRDNPAFDFLCYVDSVAGVQLLADGIRQARPGRPLDVLIELGHAAGRTGCRTPEQALDVARAAASVAGLRVVGVAGYEGGLGRELSDDVFGRVDAFLATIHATAAELATRGLVSDGGEGIILSAGGSVFFDRVAAVLGRPLPDGHRSRCVLRSGCYVAHDSGAYAALSPFTRPGAALAGTLQPALEAWGEVLSRPEAGLAIVGLGRRDVSFDMGLPIPKGVRGSGRTRAVDVTVAGVTSLNDQHAYVAIPTGTDIRVGDWMSFGISHPCTSFDKWQLLPEVDDDYRVVDVIRTHF